MTNTLWSWFTDKTAHTAAVGVATAGKAGEKKAEQDQTCLDQNYQSFTDLCVWFVFLAGAKAS